MSERNGTSTFGISTVLTTSKERILIAKRKHWFVLVAPFFVISLFFTVVNILGITIFGILLQSFFLSAATILAVTIITIGIFAKVFIDWYAHWYVVTTHKILEISSLPFFSHKVNDVLLSQVRCTEVDIQTNGMINNILDKGDIAITFDRPTHQEEFIIADIKDPMVVGRILLHSINRIHDIKEQENLWVRKRSDPDHFQFSEEINEGQYLEVN